MDDRSRARAAAPEAAKRSKAATIRGTVRSRLSDGTVLVVLAKSCIVGLKGTRSLYVRPEELPGTVAVGARVRIKIEIEGSEVES